jgi:hypothetical protein
MEPLTAFFVAVQSLTTLATDVLPVEKQFVNLAEWGISVQIV